MSEYQVLIPDVGDAQDVEVVEICVDVGQSIQTDDALLVIESDKASMEVPAPVAGTVKSIALNLGDIIDTGDLVAVLDIEQADLEPSDVNSQPVQQTTADKPVFDPSSVSVLTRDGDSRSEDGTRELYEIRLPELDHVDDIRVIEVLAAAGQVVVADQVLIVLESDSATMEVPANVAGVIDSLAVSVGDTVTDHSLLATVFSERAGSTEPTGIHVEPQSPIVPKLTAKPSSDPIAMAETRLSGSRDKAAALYAGPAVRRLARELGVDLTHVKGSGARGRIIKDDVKQFVKSHMLHPLPTESSTGIPEVEYPDFSKFGEVIEEPLTRIQSRGAQNLVRSWLNVVHVTQHDEADVTELEAFRVELNEQGQLGERRLTALPFILKACASALKEHPRFNASIAPSLQTLLLKQFIHIGVAVDTPDGLVVPVIRDVLDKGLRDIATELETISSAARNKKLTPDQISGATFTVSSLGRIGGTGFTPIINAPEVAILGVARLATKPAWINDAFEPRQFLPLSLTYDHRAINGAEGGRFMYSLVEKLEDVRRLIL